MIERAAFYLRNALTGFNPNFTEQSLSLFAMKLTFGAYFSSTGSAHKRSQSNPESPGSWNLSSLFISSIVVI